MTLIKRPPPDSNDPEEILRGTCATCKTVVEAPRFLAQRPKAQLAHARETGTFDDLLSVECPKCQARVFVVKIPKKPKPPLSS